MVVVAQHVGSYVASARVFWCVSHEVVQLVKFSRSVKKRGYVVVVLCPAPRHLIMLAARFSRTFFACSLVRSSSPPPPRHLLRVYLPTFTPLYTHGIKVKALARSDLRRPLPSPALGSTSIARGGGASRLQMLWSGGRRTQGNEVCALRRGRTAGVLCATINCFLSWADSPTHVSCLIVLELKY